MFEAENGKRFKIIDPDHERCGQVGRVHQVEQRADFELEYRLQFAKGMDSFRKDQIVRANSPEVELGQLLTRAVMVLACEPGRIQERLQKAFASGLKHFRTEDVPPLLADRWYKISSTFDREDREWDEAKAAKIAGEVFDLFKIMKISD